MTNLPFDILDEADYLDIIKYIKRKPFKVNEPERSKHAKELLKVLAPKLDQAQIEWAIQDLYQRGFLTDDKENKSFVIGEFGKKAIRRGWIYERRKWYDAEPIRKYSFILSVIAFIISIIGRDNIINGFLFLVEKIKEYSFNQ